MIWQPIKTAPSLKKLLVWGNGPVRFGYRDEFNNWRASHHGPLKEPPTHWMEIPEPPVPMAKKEWADAYKYQPAALGKATESK